jgi:hypothetical protein
MTQPPIIELPHIDHVKRMTREECLHYYTPIEQQLQDLREEIRRVNTAQDLGLPYDEERFRRLRYGKQLRARLQQAIKERLLDLKRAELGGDPVAMLHRRYLHAVFEIVKDLPQRDAIFARARDLSRTLECTCSQCGFPPRGPRTSGVVDTQDDRPSLSESEPSEPPLD